MRRAPLTMVLTTSPAPVAAASKSRPPRRGRRRGDGRAALGFLAPNLLGFLIFTILPIGGSLVLAFFNWPLLGQATFTGFDNFIRLFTADTVFWPVLGNTIYFVVGYVAANLVVALGLALWLTSKVRFKGVFRIVFFLPVVAPMVANAAVWRLLFTQDTGLFAQLWRGVFGTAAPNWLGDPHWAMPAVILMSLWAGFGYNMLIFIAGIESLPVSLLEAAEIDGAGWYRRTVSIVLPLLSPSMFFAVVMTIISSLQVFAQPYILTGGGPGNSTTTLVYYLYQQGFQNYAMGYASSVAWALFLLIMGLTALQFSAQKRWVHYQ